MLSIITITYKDAPGLAATIDSLRPLSGRTDFEHVVVDSSPELDAPVLATLPAGWPLVHVKPPPKGIYPAMNAGLAASTGDVLWFLNGGDRLVDAAALDAGLAELQAAPGADVLCCGVWFTRDGEPFPFGRKVADFTESVLGLDAVPHQGMLYRRRWFERVGPYTERFRAAGDWEHHWRGLLAGLSAKPSDVMLARVDLGGLSSTNDALWWRETNELNRWLRGVLPTRLYVRHMLAFGGWLARMGLQRAGAAAPGVKRVLAPIYRRLWPDPRPRVADPLSGTNASNQSR